jgi:O-antigen/teichoic acid export membrane protein
MIEKKTTKAEETAELSLGRESLVGFVGKLIIGLFGFVGIVYFFRELGAAGIGVYYTLLAGAKLGIQLQDGVTTAIRKRISEVSADQSRYLGLSFITWATVSGLVASSVIIANPLLRKYIEAPEYLLGGVAMLASLGLFALTNQFYIGIGNPGKANWNDAFRSIVTFAIQVSLLILGYMEFGLIWGFIIGNLVVAVCVFGLIRVRPMLPSKTELRRTMSFAKWSLPSGILNNVYTRLDVLFLWWFVGPTAVGLYEPALRMTVPATFVAASISQSLVVKSSGLDSQNRSVVEDLQNSLKYAGLIAIPIFFGSLAISNSIMRYIFGASAAPAATALVGLALFQLFSSYWKIMSSVVGGVDRPDLNVKVGAITVAFNIPIAIILVQRYGLEGVVAGTVLAELFRLVIGWRVVTGLFDNPGLPNEVLQQLFAGVVMFGVIEIMTSTGVIMITNLLWLALVVGLGAAVYFATLIGVSRHFRKTVQIVIGETVSLYNP